MKKLWYVMAAVFIAAGAVQFNDPDSLPWVAIYWVAAVVSALWPGRRGLPSTVQLLVLIGAFAVEIVGVLWAILLVRDVWAVGKFDLGSEVQREFGGLVIVAITMSVAVSKAKKTKLTSK